jgi:ribosomal protein L16 Arg81 hydroxylase
MSAFPPKSVPVPVIHVEEISDAAFHQQFVRPGHPVIVRGAMQGWRALDRWQNPEYLAGSAGERVIQACDPISGSQSQVKLGPYWRKAFDKGDAKFSYINAAIEVQGRPGVLGNLISDVELCRLLPNARHLATKVFAGNDSRCGLHYHPDTEAFLGQVFGEKRVLLFPPRDRSKLYPLPWHSSYVTFSQAPFSRDGDWPDPQTYPRLTDTHPMECVMRPGEMLYIPIYWWHVVWGSRVAICATQFFRSTLRKRFFSHMGLRSNYLNRIGGLRLRMQAHSKALTIGE